jgi:peptide/nickel transport system substrate-binding protein
VREPGATHGRTGERPFLLHMMKKLRWQLLVVFLSLVAIGVLLVSQQPVRLPGVAEPVIEPTVGGICSEALVGSLIRLNPLLDWNNQADRDVDRLIFSGLMRFDAQGMPVGDLADSWAYSQDGKVYNFSIRPEAIWHDGEPVTTADISFTISLIRDDAIPFPADQKELWNQVEVVELDANTIQFRLPEPFAPFLDYLTFGVLPEHLLGDLPPEDLINDDFNLAPVGSGPFRFDRLLTENGQISGVSLTANQDYYSQPPFIEQFIFRYYPDEASALAAYEAEEVNGLSQVTPEVLPTVLKEPGLNLYTGRLPELSLVYFNLDNAQRPFFQDRNIRHALLEAINRQWIIDRLLNSQAIMADGPIFPGTWAYFDNLDHTSFDRDKAIKTLKDAGYTIPASGGNVRTNEDGVAFSFELLYPDEPPYTEIATAIQKDWLAIGVQVDIQALPYDELIKDHLETHTFDAALVELNFTRSPDPDPYPFWHQTQAAGGQNYGQWDDRQASEYLEKARTTADIGERARDYRNFQVRFATELPALPLFYPVYSYAVSNEVQGVQMGPLFDPSDRFQTVTDWFLLAKAALPTSVSVTDTPTP